MYSVTVSPSPPDDLTLDDLDLVTINTLYVQHPHDLSVRRALARCGDHYQAMFGEKLALHLNPTGNGSFVRYRSSGVSLAKYLETNATADRPFAPRFTSGTHYKDASSHSLNIWAGDAQWVPAADVAGYFAATLPFAFLNDHPEQGAFQDLVHEWCKIIRPYCGYAGIGAIQS